MTTAFVMMILRFVTWPLLKIKNGFFWRQNHLVLTFGIKMWGKNSHYESTFLQATVLSQHFTAETQAKNIWWYPSNLWLQHWFYLRFVLLKQNLGSKKTKASPFVTRKNNESWTQLVASTIESLSSQISDLKFCRYIALTQSLRIISRRKEALRSSYNFPSKANQEFTPT